MGDSFIQIKADYLQRTRSYSFLITLAVTVYVAYSFVPPNTAAYTTLSVPGYRGAYNSAWVGYVSATMTTVMLSLYGFLLVNSGIRKDIDTEVGLIIASTPISNFNYLLSKLFSNFLILMTIAGITFAVSMLMFLLRGSGYPFIFDDFILPYILFALPALFLVSGLAVVAEVFLGKHRILQFISYFFICGAVMAILNRPETGIPAATFDPFGLSLVTGSIKSQLNIQFHEHIEQVSFGFIFIHHKIVREVVWNGVDWTGLFIFSRLLWIALSLALVYVSSLFFHRFDVEHSGSKTKRLPNGDLQTESNRMIAAPISKEPLPPIASDYGILPFIKTELLLLVRKGSKWFWLVIGTVWVAMLFAPLHIAHAYLLPLIWFLQVSRISELVTKEQTYKLHYFTFSSYKPLVRMLPAQLLAGVSLMVVLALPLLGRYFLAFNIFALTSILCGAVFIVQLAVCLGIVSAGKKLFEVVFFMLTYAVTQQIPTIDYLGAAPHAHPAGFITGLLALTTSFLLISFVVRNYQIRHL